MCVSVVPCVCVHVCLWFCVFVSMCVSMCVYVCACLDLVVLVLGGPSCPLDPEQRRALGNHM